MGMGWLSPPPERGFFDDVLVRHMVTVAVVFSVPVVLSAVVWHREAAGAPSSTLTRAWILYAAAMAADLGSVGTALGPLRHARVDGRRLLWLAVSLALLVAAMLLAVAASKLARG